MGIRLEDIRKLGPPLSPKERLFQIGSCLDGAHLPPRGFYFIKAVRGSRLRAQSRSRRTYTGPSGWLFLWRRTSKESALAHPSGDPVSSLDEQPAVSGSQSGELELEMP